MKGIIFNLLEEFICANWGDAKYEEVVTACHSSIRRAYVGPGTYPDGELIAIAGTAAGILGVPLPDAVRAFGKFAFARLAERYPVFMEGHSGPKSFLESVEKVIHVEVRKLMRDADPPRFSYRDDGPDGLIIEYRSERKLCALMEGLIEGAGDWFGTPIRQAQALCMHRGDPCCEFRLGFGRA